MACGTREAWCSHHTQRYGDKAVRVHQFAAVVDLWVTPPPSGQTSAPVPSDETSPETDAESRDELADLNIPTAEMPG